LIAFIIWPQRPRQAEELPWPLKIVHQNIQFTMEMERDTHIPFLDTDIYGRPDGYLGHKVYRKPTHTNFHLNSTSLSPPDPTSMPYFQHLVHRARALCDQDGLHAELVFLRDIFRQNGYMDLHIHRALSPPPRVG
jgi:hypothetical protein